ncbi:MAG: ATP-dependent DNA helicase [Gammaproteobacteria bacterium]|nr:ATP-dependent DNA helicase [Gammaproteobacteria bacterium]
MATSYEMLGADGILANTLDGFLPRCAQQQMAECVEQVLDQRSISVIEAGTGTGKTYAYLLPALLSGRKVIISTGTRHLQDQLYHRDLPLIKKALKSGIKTALLKGRSNYLCSYRLQQQIDEIGHTNTAALVEIKKIQQWAAVTRFGDIAELVDVPEDAMVWRQVTSTLDNCLGMECPVFSDCYVANARKEAMDADLLVINHHLLLADMALKDEGFGELLPGVDALILDEAHQLPELATRFFGEQISSRQLQTLARDVTLECLQYAADMRELLDAAHHLETDVADFRLAMGRGNNKGFWKDISGSAYLRDSLTRLHGGLQGLYDYLQIASTRSRGLDNCYQRSEVLLVGLARLTDVTPEGYIHWYETSGRYFRLIFTPLDSGPVFKRHMAAVDSAWIFTSATLAVGNSFTHFSQAMGLDDVHTLKLDSPFSYEENARLYLPEGLPEPNTPGYNTAVIQLIRDLLPLSQGRTFVLFTSHRALREAAEALQNDDLNYPLLVQGEFSRGEMLERFRQAGNAVLLGTSSFWEGVDVRGEALSCVIIDKLPFASPGDPVLQARIEHIRASGVNPFMQYQLPNAVITLKQGVGRLIRDVSDRGLLVLCDPRLRSKFYGKTFLNSIPKMPRCNNLQEVAAFFDKTGVRPQIKAGADPGIERECIQ